MMHQLNHYTMRHLIIAIVMFSVACNRAPHSQDNNPAEGVGSQAEKDRENMDTNEEALLGAGSEQSDAGILAADRAFVAEAANAGLTEVRLGELAAERGSTPKVKQFANLMVKDHTAANEELKKLAARKKIVLPQELCSDCLAKYNELASLSGSQFDKRYMELMVADHRAAVAKFSSQADNEKGGELSAWAKEKLPVLKHHLLMSESLSGAKNSGN
jgi:putative membrane protein